MTDEPDNVVPMRGHTHECPSCHVQIVTERLYEGHSEACMQPEIRMRRAEARILELINAVNTQTETLETAHACTVKLVDAHERLQRRVMRLEKLSGIDLKDIDDGKPTEDPEPDTKRSGALLNTDGLSERSLEALSLIRCPQCWGGLPSGEHATADCPGTPPYTEPAEPAGEAPAGAEPASGGPERPS